MKRFRLDTLFLRLFVLMWVVLVLSHLAAYLLAVPLSSGGEGPVRRLSLSGMPAMPSLPPGNPLASSDGAARGPGGGPPPRPMPQGGPPPGPRPAPGGAPHAPPDAGPRFGPGADPMAGGGPRPGLPVATLWFDYALRALLIGLGALLGARWLAAPMRRLSQAATALAQGLGRRETLPTLDERQGTVEVRDTAQAFNQMARQLQAQFDQRSLHMAALSHDLRTPLTRLRLRLERLPGEAAQAAAADIREMDELIDGSLAVMREQASGAAPSVLDLGALLQSLVDDLAEQGHTVELAEPGHARVRAHPAALRRVLGNLLDNALRHGGQARVQVAAGAPGGVPEVQVWVDDAGPGIPPEQLERVFQPWVRLPGEQAPPGSGLGLAIARDLAEREGGRLRLANRPEGGLRACLSLPTA